MWITGWVVLTVSLDISVSVLHFIFRSCFEALYKYGMIIVISVSIIIISVIIIIIII